MSRHLRPVDKPLVEHRRPRRPQPHVSRSTPRPAQRRAARSSPKDPSTPSPPSPPATAPLRSRRRGPQQLGRRPAGRLRPPAPASRSTTTPSVGPPPRSSANSSTTATPPGPASTSRRHGDLNDWHRTNQERWPQVIRRAATLAIPDNAFETHPPAWPKAGCSRLQVIGRRCRRNAPWTRPLIGRTALGLIRSHGTSGTVLGPVGLPRRVGTVAGARSLPTGNTEAAGGSTSIRRTGSRWRGFGCRGPTPADAGRRRLMRGFGTGRLSFRSPRASPRNRSEGAARQAARRGDDDQRCPSGMPSPRATCCGSRRPTRSRRAVGAFWMANRSRSGRVSPSRSGIPEDELTLPWAGDAVGSGDRDGGDVQDRGTRPGRSVGHDIERRARWDAWSRPSPPRAEISSRIARGTTSRTG